MKGKNLVASILAGLILLSPVIASAAGRFEYYVFGVNLRTFQNSNWLKVAAGAAASILTHELGHALYLQAAGKEWELRGSSSGLAIVTPDYLTDDESQRFGMAGFALQTAVGTLLASFEKTRTSDFTKGWVGAGTVQLFSYTSRPHVDGDDFQMIERGGGDAEQIRSVFAMVSGYNFRRLQPSSSKYSLSNPRSNQNARFYNGYYLDTFSADAEARFHALEIDSFLEVGPGEAPLMQDARAEARAEHIIGSGSPLSNKGHIGASSLCNPRASRCEGNPFGTYPVSTEKLGSGFD